MELENENLPEEITSRQQFIEEFVEKYKIDTKKFKGKTHLVCWKINVGDLSENEINQYVEQVRENLEEQMKKIAWTSCYIVTRTEPTQMTIIELRSMKYVKV